VSGTTHSDMPTVTLTLAQVTELMQTLPRVPQEFAQYLHPHTTCVHNLDYVSRTGVANLQAKYEVTGDGDLRITLTMQGGQYVWTVTLPCH
jgi:hypothetical protein